MSEIKIKSEEIVETTAEEAGVETVEVYVEPSVHEKTLAAKESRDPTLRAQAFKLYMDHTPYSKIQEVLNVPKGTLLSWIYHGKWADQRNANDEMILKDDLQSKKALLSAISLEVMEGVLKAIKRDSRDGGFKAKDVPVYLSALTSIEKLSRLSLGLATSISEERSKRAQFVLPAEQLKQISEVKIRDPFAVDEDATDVNSKPDATRSAEDS